MFRCGMAEKLICGAVHVRVCARESECQNRDRHSIRTTECSVLPTVAAAPAATSLVMKIPLIFVFVFFVRLPTAVCLLLLLSRAFISSHSHPGTPSALPPGLCAPRARAHSAPYHPHTPRTERGSGGVRGFGKFQRNALCLPFSPFSNTLPFDKSAPRRK